jgi:hypothetical protein
MEFLKNICQVILAIHVISIHTAYKWKILLNGEFTMVSQPIRLILIMREKLCFEEVFLTLPINIYSANIATTQPTTQNNLKQLLLGWLYYQ